MKKMIYFGLMAFLFFIMGCSKVDDVSFVNPGDNQVKSGAPAIANAPEFEKTIKVWYKILQDSTDLIEIFPGYFIPNSGWCSGHATHVGKIDEKNSTWYYTEFIATPPIMTAHANQTITFANGESMFSTSVLVIHKTESVHYGTITVTVNGGTGRFENATGTIFLEGTHDAIIGDQYWRGEGIISY